MPDFAFETECRGGPVCGIDEAGRGPWAGPVVAAAVIIEQQRLSNALLAAIDDSKAMSRAARERVYAGLVGSATIGVGQASVAEIDRLNILAATLLAMQRAVAALGRPPAVALVDGNRPPTLPCPVRCIVGGDALSLSIAAASIVAKVTRDRLMAALDDVHPGYGWRTNAGYGTARHRAALARLGPSREHRMSFRPLRAAEATLPRGR